MDDRTPEKKSFDRRKDRMFMGTIITASAYGALTLLFIAAIIVSQAARELFGEKLFVFSVVFIGGALFVILMMVLTIINTKFEPSVPDRNMYVCPDYWELRETPAVELEKLNDEDKLLAKYQCVKSEKHFGTTASSKNSSADSSIHTFATLIDSTKTNHYDESIANAVNKVNAVTPSVTDGDRFSCDLIYPGLLANAEDMDNPNRLRCKYASVCNDVMSFSYLCN
jgi:hypothetical protein